MAERPLPTRRLRAFPRVVKRKMSNYGVKRAKHRAWPRPTLPPLRRSSSSGRPSQPPSVARAAASLAVALPFAMGAQPAPNQPNQPKLSALGLVALVRAGARFEKGRLVERPKEAPEEEIPEVAA
jgi:hypothetical protein